MASISKRTRAAVSGAAIALSVVLVILQVRSQATRGSLGIKWFRPSAELRDSLFGLEALKEQFSVERETRANRQLHAQQYRSGAWYGTGDNPANPRGSRTKAVATTSTPFRVGCHFGIPIRSSYVKPPSPGDCGPYLDGWPRTEEDELRL